MIKEARVGRLAPVGSRTKPKQFSNRLTVLW